MFLWNFYTILGLLHYRKDWAFSEGSAGFLLRVYLLQCLSWVISFLGCSFVSFSPPTSFSAFCIICQSVHSLQGQRLNWISKSCHAWQAACCTKEENERWVLEDDGEEGGDWSWGRIGHDTCHDGCLTLSIMRVYLEGGDLLGMPHDEILREQVVLEFDAWLSEMKRNERHQRKRQQPFLIARVIKAHCLSPCQKLLMTTLKDSHIQRMSLK